MILYKIIFKTRLCALHPWHSLQPDSRDIAWRHPTWTLHFMARTYKSTSSKASTAIWEYYKRSLKTTTQRFTISKTTHYHQLHGHTSNTRAWQHKEKKNFNHYHTTRWTKKSYSNQTGCVPFMSSLGNDYMFIMYDYDTNIILEKAIASRQAKNITDVCLKWYDILKRSGHASTLHILNNKCSNNMKAAFDKNSVTFQAVPPYVHGHNAAKRAIQTWKSHFLVGLSSYHPNFPLSQWDRLPWKCRITLNHLHASRCHCNYEHMRMSLATMISMHIQWHHPVLKF